MKGLFSSPSLAPFRRARRGGKEGRGPRLFLFVTNGRPSEERDLILDGVDEVADDGEDDKEEDDDDGYDDVAFDHLILVLLRTLGEEGGLEENG